MKIWNKISAALLSLTLMASMTACHEEHAEYDAASAVSGAQVFFSAEQSALSVVELDRDAQVAYVELSRANTKGDLTVALDVKQTGFENSDMLLGIPQSVTFADGKATAEIAISYDPSAIDFEDADTVTLTIKDATTTTSYGYASYTFKALKPAPWNSLGKCTYTDIIIAAAYGVKPASYAVELQENAMIPGYYRLVNPYGEAFPYNEEGDYDPNENKYLYIHAEDPDFIYIERHNDLLKWGDDDYIGVISYVSYFMENGYALEEVKSVRPDLFGKFADHEISFPANSIIFLYGGAVWAPCSGTFSIVMPGYSKKDYSLSLSYQGIFTSAEGEVSARVKQTLGDNVIEDEGISYMGIVVPKEYDAAAVADALASGELEGIDLVRQDAVVEIPFDPKEYSGDLQVVVAVLTPTTGESESGEWEVKNYTSASFEFTGGAPAKWELLGKGWFTDDVVYTFWIGEEAPVYEVEIYANESKPGIYRIMNPYSEEVYPLTTEELDDNELAPEGYYIEVNASDPEAVYIAPTPLHMDWYEYGEMSMWTAGWDAYDYFGDIETAKEEGYMGSLSEDVITFPLLSYQDENQEGEIETYYYQGSLAIDGDPYDFGLGDFKITLPTASPEVKAEMKMRALKTHILGTKRRVVRKQATAHKMTAPGRKYGIKRKKNVKNTL